MADISGFGLVVNLIASETFPTGITLTQFADDADPVEMTSIQIADKAMGLNGDLITWNRAIPVPCVLSVIPGTDDDNNLAIIAENNRSGRGKIVTRDIISISIVYPDGTSLFLTQGTMTDSMFGKSIASAGRMKSKNYSFSFENMTRA